MKIFLLGLPNCGCSTVAKSLTQDSKYCYVDGSSWVKKTFRQQKPGEHDEQYHDEYHQYFINRLKFDPLLCSNNIKASIQATQDSNYVIDGIATPADFTTFFDFNKDFVVFLNRTDNQDVRIKDYQNISVSVIRDYCFWLASAGLLNKSKWHEYNFKFVGGHADRFKSMGSKNSVFILGSLDKVIFHLKETIVNLPSQEF